MTNDDRRRLRAVLKIHEALTRGPVASPSTPLPLDVWRDLGRDLAIADHGDGRGVRDRDLLTELRAVATRIDQGALRRFLDRLDRLGAAVEGYASPELVLDALLLAWPRPSATAGSAA